MFCLVWQGVAMQSMFTSSPNLISVPCVNNQRLFIRPMESQVLLRTAFMICLPHRKKKSLEELIVEIRVRQVLYVLTRLQ